MFYSRKKSLSRTEFYTRFCYTGALLAPPLERVDYFNTQKVGSLPFRVLPWRRSSRRVVGLTRSLQWRCLLRSRQMVYDWIQWVKSQSPRIHVEQSTGQIIFEIFAEYRERRGKIRRTWPTGRWKIFRIWNQSEE